MPTFEPFAVVAARFPYVELEHGKRRPALVVSRPHLLETSGLLWVLMITSARNEPWPDDIPIDDLVLAGLRKPSVIRPSKIATIEASAAEPIGRLSAGTAARVAAALRDMLATHP
ncbi:MAG TPA: type II toxin-antitoxin system PemK/MazF family toxin [Azospirillaceae bacterium]|nr:type II toxin-antitoxin system PemK/MazF family toxin [Azospirillaceae bacterium]